MEGAKLNRGHALRVYLTPGEAERASELAGGRGLSASAWARTLVLEQIERAGAVPARDNDAGIES